MEHIFIFALVIFTVSGHGRLTSAEQVGTYPRTIQGESLCSIDAENLKQSFDDWGRTGLGGVFVDCIASSIYVNRRD